MSFALSKTVKSKCADPTCNNSAKSKGLCGKHYMREANKARGIPASPTRGMTLIERLEFYCGAPDENGCIEWQGSINKYGYGLTTVNGKTVTAHRAMYMQKVGRIPEGAFLLHTCDNRKCVNPAHLVIGDTNENMADMVAKGRQYRPIGSMNNMSKITERDALEIFNMPGRHQDIADAYGVTQGLVSMIKSGKRWAHVTAQAEGVCP